MRKYFIKNFEKIFRTSTLKNSVWLAHFFRRQPDSAVAIDIL